MAERNPPLFMDVSSVYSGDELALPYRDILAEGIVGAGALAVSAGTGNTINIAAGAAWVLGDTDVNFQPNYRVYNDAVVNLGINPDPTNPRKVRVVAQITDAAFLGATRQWALVAIHGTPAGSPTDPALPASALNLATILVPAAAASSAAYTFTDARTAYGLSTGLVPAASQLAYGQITTGVIPTATTEAAADTIVSASAYTFDGVTEVLVEFFCPQIQGSDAPHISLCLYEGSSSIGVWFKATRVANTYTGGVYAARKLTPTAGSKTYSCRAFVSAGTGTTVDAGAGGVGNLVPAFIRVSRV